MRLQLFFFSSCSLFSLFIMSGMHLKSKFGMTTYTIYNIDHTSTHVHIQLEVMNRRKEYWEFVWCFVLASTYKHIHMYIYTQTHTHVHTHTRTHAHAHTYTYIHTHTPLGMAKQFVLQKTGTKSTHQGKCDDDIISCFTCCCSMTHHITSHHTILVRKQQTTQKFEKEGQV